MRAEQRTNHSPSLHPFAQVFSYRQYCREGGLCQLMRAVGHFWCLLDYTIMFIIPSVELLLKKKKKHAWLEIVSTMTICLHIYAHDFNWVLIQSFFSHPMHILGSNTDLQATHSEKVPVLCAIYLRQGHRSWINCLTCTTWPDPLCRAKIYCRVKLMKENKTKKKPDSSNHTTAKRISDQPIHTLECMRCAYRVEGAILLDRPMFWTKQEIISPGISELIQGTLM